MEFMHYYKKNESGRDFFTTDIHGNFDILHEQMRLHVFDTNKDRLFVGGDNCDRGPNSHWILDYINEPWFISVRGNHEEMVIAYIKAMSIGDEREARYPFNLLYSNGGQWFFEISEQDQMRIYESFKSLPLAIELETRSGGRVGIIHAEVPYSDWEYFKGITKAELDWNGSAIAQWARTKYDKQDVKVVKNIDKVYVGHTPTTSGSIEVLGNVHYSDLGSFFRGKLAFVEIE
jgi:serine/threonine protein phosphatase 1